MPPNLQDCCQRCKPSISNKFQSDSTFYTTSNKKIQQNCQLGLWAPSSPPVVVFPTFHKTSPIDLKKKYLFKYPFGISITYSKLNIDSFGKYSHNHDCLSFWGVKHEVLQRNYAQYLSKPHQIHGIIIFHAQLDKSLINFTL